LSISPLGASDDEPVDEKIVKYHPRNSISSLTLLLFIIISIATAYEKLDWDFKSSLTDSRSKSNETISKGQSANTDNTNFSAIDTEENADKIKKNSKRQDVKSNVSRTKKSTSATKSRIKSITNNYDQRILSTINDGEHYFNRGHYPECISHFEKLLKKYPDSPRAMFGQAKCLDRLAEQMRSNELLSKAIDAYSEVAKQPAITNELLKQAMLQQAERLIFFGRTRDAVNVLAKLTEKLPSDAEVLNKLGTSYLIMGSNRKAFNIHHKVNQNNTTIMV